VLLAHPVLKPEVIQKSTCHCIVIICDFDHGVGRSGQLVQNFVESPVVPHDGDGTRAATNVENRVSRDRVARRFVFKES